MSEYKRIGESQTSPAANTVRKVIDVAPYVGSNGYIQNAEFIQKPIAALELSDIKGPVAIVMHRTVSSTASSALSAFQRGIGTHFVIDKDGTTYQCASLFKKTAHVGPIRSRCHIEGTCSTFAVATFSGWNSRMKCFNHEKSKKYPIRYPMNEDSVGIEVVAMYDADTRRWDPTPPLQSRAVHFLVDFLKNEYRLANVDIYEHDKIAWKTEGEGADLYYVPDIPIVQPKLPPA